MTFLARRFPILPAALVLALAALSPAVASEARARRASFPDLRKEAIGLLERGARQPMPAPSPEVRERLLDLGDRLWQDIDRAALDDDDWIDYHLVLQAIARRLTPVEDIPHSTASDPSRALYEWRLRFIHQLDLDADDLAILGENVYGQTIRELEDLAEEVEPGTPWQELSRRARRDRPATPGDLLPLCRRLALEAWRFTEATGWVSVPDVAVELGIEEGKARRDKPYAWYQPGRRDGRFYRGTYVVTPIPPELEPQEITALLDDLGEHWLRVIALHEAIPGHHLQFAVASNVQSPVRDWGYTSVFVEGWGLYCEDSMRRHGYFTSALARVEQLRMRLWRAARVRIDSGLHSGTMDREEAERLLVEGVLTNPDNARREVDRYLKDPTQPMSYIVGQLQMDELRRACQARAGTSWDERAFHDRLLSYGPIPIDLIAAAMLEERDRHDRLHRWSRARF